ncbi:uncharacterized protein LOC101939531 isoform X2 [Chrysemys picta bellii]|uniref:uncharacterized protein LOC101939531 isoform X2 n=1 Tax=Chrysemys picta bellii TaxID=8478 RepID=UPI0032B135EF
MDDCLKVDPSAMEQQLVEQRRSLLGRCREEMEEPEETLLTALEAELTREAETFLETYRRRYQCHTINQRPMERARRDHADLLREKDGLSQRVVDCLKMDPGAMAEQLTEQHRSLLGRCRKEMKEPEETLLTALEAELTREAETFLETYRRRYQSHTNNQRLMDRARRDHAAFLREKDGLSQRMDDCLKMDPGAMAEQLAEQQRSLLGRCREEMKEPEKETLLTALEAELTREAETFVETYRRRYQSHTNNQRLMDRARRDHAAFLREKDGLSQRMVDCLKMDPSAMLKQLAEQRRSLLGRCREEMEETLLTALEEELTREAETFLETYRRRYQCHTINQRVMERARRDHADLLRENDGLSQRMDDCLKVDPSAMEQQLVEQRRSLLGRCREEMEEPEETLLTALEAELTREAETFLETYRRHYQCHANQRVMDSARRDHAAFLREKDGLSQRMVDCLKMDPSAMLKQLTEQHRSLLGRCREEMKEPEETLLTALEAELTREAETFLETYRRRYQCHTINQRVMDSARQDHALFLREKDGLSQRVVDCLKVDPGAMAEQLAEQQRSLLGRCRKEMKEPEETLLTALEEELTREAETFVETYRRRYQCHTINQRVMDSARRDHAAFLREKDGLSQRMDDCLKMDPSAMLKQLAEQRRSLLGRCREEMKEPGETLLTALEAELTREAETFLETYRRRYQCHTINQRPMERARRDHADLLREKDGLSQRMDDCLKMDPGAMAEQLAEQRRSLLGRCREEMEEPEETLLTALEEELTREAETFLETYRRRYQCHTINQRPMDRARRDHAAFLREKGPSKQHVTNGGLPSIYYFGAVIAIALGVAICGSWNSSVPLTAAPTGREFKMSTNSQSYPTHHSQPPPEAKPSPPKPNPNPKPSSHLSVSSSGNSEVRNRKTNSQAEKNLEKKTTEEETEHKRRDRERQLVQALVGRIMAQVHECNVEMFTGEAILVGSQAQHLHVRTESSSNDYDFLVPIQYNTNLILMGSLYSNVDTPKGLLPGKKSMEPGVPVYCWGDKVVVDYNKLIIRDLSERKTLDLSLTEEAINTINDLQLQLWKNGVTTSNVTQGLYNCVKALTQGNPLIRMGNFSEESAAVQLSAEVDGRAVSIDLVPIIRNKVNISMAWPQQDLRWFSDLWDREQGTEQRKPTWNITEIYKTGTDLVPKNSYWRLTFSRAETQLLKDIDADGGCRREALQVLKQINMEKWRRRYGKVLTSYHLKMVLFWASHLSPETENWATLPDAVGTLLKVLEFCLEKKHLPSYFLPSINFFDWHRTEEENSLRNLGLEALRLEVRLMRCSPEQYKPQGLGLFIQRERELDVFRREHQNDFEELKNPKEGK